MLKSKALAATCGLLDHPFNRTAAGNRIGQIDDRHSGIRIKAGVSQTSRTTAQGKLAIRHRRVTQTGRSALLPEHANQRDIKTRDTGNADRDLGTWRIRA
ncbi:MAG: hypothetical protein HPM95_18305 [Alphaproteobacteria bacterium]|nr:hypothetical protein [Alphaproteobacteria bacterium]